METLREISNDYKYIMQYAFEAEEITDEVFEKIKQIDSKFEEKAENIAYIIEELKYKCGVVNQEIDRLTERLVKWSNNIKRLQDYVKNEMVYIGKEKIETPMYTIKIRKSVQTQTDDNFISEAQEKHLNNLIRVIPEKIEPDKQAIKEYLTEGNDLEHAYIVEKQNLSIK